VKAGLFYSHLDHSGLPACDRCFLPTDWANKKAPGKGDFSGVIDKDGVTPYRAGFADYQRAK